MKKFAFLLIALLFVSCDDLDDKLNFIEHGFVTDTIHFADGYKYVKGSIHIDYAKGIGTFRII